MALQSIPVIIAGIDAGLNLFSTGKQYFGDNTDYKVLTQLKNIEKAILGIDLDRSLKRINKELQGEYERDIKNKLALIEDEKSKIKSLENKKDDVKRKIDEDKQILSPDYVDNVEDVRNRIGNNAKSLVEFNKEIKNTKSNIETEKSKLKSLEESLNKLKTEEQSSQPLRTLDNSLKEILDGFRTSLDVLNANLEKLIPKNAKADGGIVTRPTFSLVGEAGAEAVIPLKHGSVPVSLNTPFSINGILKHIDSAMGEGKVHSTYENISYKETNKRLNSITADIGKKCILNKPKKTYLNYNDDKDYSLVNSLVA